MPITAPGVNLKNLLPPPAIDPSDRPQEQMTLADMLVHKFKDFVRPVTGKVEHWLNDPVAQAEQALFVGGPMIFAGPKALTANIPKMKQAQKMVKAGKDRGQVWKDTGWFQDVDGQWKFEIDDSVSKTNLSYGGRKLDEAHGNLGQSLSHEKLYKAYPEMKTKQASILEGDIPMRGSFARDEAANYNEWTPQITAQGPQAKSPLLHELQHAVQGREGFAKGGSPGAMAQLKNKNLARLNFLNQEQSKIAKKMDELSAGYRTPKLGKEKEFNALASEYDAIMKEKSLMDAGVTQGDPFEAYRRLAGEAEARNVQTRMNFSPQERMTKPPWTTLDVPEDQLLVRMLQDGPAEATVWHGSPHKFTKFDMSKIGTGEGAQAYGHGLYFADNPKVAKEYQRTLGGEGFIAKTASEPITQRALEDMGYMPESGRRLMTQLKAHDGNIDDVLERLLSLKKEYSGRYGVFSKQNKEVSEALSIAKQFKGQKLTPKIGGKLYKVDLPDESIAKMLDWDKPLSEQPESVRKAWLGTKAKLPPHAYDDLGGDFSLLYGPNTKADEFLGTMNSLKGQSGNKIHFGEGLLKDRGIPGIKYLDQGSRGKGKGTYNYVVFDDTLPEILEINGKAFKGLKKKVAK